LGKLIALSGLPAGLGGYLSAEAMQDKKGEGRKRKGRLGREARTGKGIGP